MKQRITSSVAFHFLQSIIKGNAKLFGYFVRNYPLSDLLNARGHAGCTPLHLAATDSRAWFFQTLVDGAIRQGIALNDCVDGLGRAPLHYALMHAQTVVLNHAATHHELFQTWIGKVDAQGQLPLHLAAQYCRHRQGWEKLAPFFSDPSRIEQKNSQRQTAMHVAVLHNNSEALHVLLRAGASVEVQDAQGNTPLHLAALQGEERLVKKILKKIIVDKKNLSLLSRENNAGFTALKIAEQKGFSRVVDELRLMSEHAKYLLCALPNAPQGLYAKDAEFIQLVDSRDTELRWAIDQGLEEIQHYFTQQAIIMEGHRKRVWGDAFKESFCPFAVFVAGELPGERELFDTMNKTYSVYSSGQYSVGAGDMLSLGIGVMFFALCVISGYQIMSAPYNRVAQEELALRNLFVQYQAAKKHWQQMVTDSSGGDEERAERRTQTQGLEALLKNFLTELPFQKKPNLPTRKIYNASSFATRSDHFYAHTSVIAIGACAASGLAQVVAITAKYAMCFAGVSLAHANLIGLALGVTTALLCVSILAFNYQRSCNANLEQLGRQHEKLFRTREWGYYERKKMQRSHPGIFAKQSLKSRSLQNKTAEHALRDGRFTASSGRAEAIYATTPALC